MQRKGISPLIATVLLIAFTIAVGGIISVWLTQFARTQADEQTDKADKLNTCSESILFFSKSDVNASGQFINIIVTNEGTVNQTDIDVYLTHKNGTFTSNTTTGSTTSSGNTVNATIPLRSGQKTQFNLSFLNGGLIIGDKTNVSKLTLTLGPNDECAGKSYSVTF